MPSAREIMAQMMMVHPAVEAMFQAASRMGQGSLTRDQQVTAGRIANDANSRGQVNRTASSNGTRMNLHPEGPPMIGDDYSSVDLGGLFGSDVRQQVARPSGRWAFEDFVNALMNAPKDEHGARVGAEMDPFLWSRVAPRLEDAYQRPPQFNTPEMDALMANVVPPGRGTYQSRQAGRFLTPEQRAAQWDANRSTVALQTRDHPQPDAYDRQQWRVDEMLRQLFP